MTTDTNTNNYDDAQYQPQPQPQYGINIMGLVFALILGALGVLALLLSLGIDFNWIYLVIGIPTGLAILLLVAAFAPTKNR